MYFRFGTRKMVEAIAALVRSCDACSPPHMSGLRLLKLLYIADRESLQETGSPIVGTKPVAMDYGPVHSEAYDLIKGSRWGEEVWSESIRRDGREVVLVKDPGVLALSRYEIDQLAETARRYRDMEDWDLVALTHTFAEWKRNYHAGTSTPIPMEDIIDAVGRSEDAEDILREAEETRALNRLLGAEA
jgi:uncharacterized phage-associated protein